jgi:hypothetical protein
MSTVRVTRDLLMLVGLEVPLTHILRWTAKQREQAEEWASKSHLRASDNIVRVPVKPAFLNRYSRPERLVPRKTSSDELRRILRQLELSLTKTYSRKGCRDLHRAMTRIETELDLRKAFPEMEPKVKAA